MKNVLLLVGLLWPLLSTRAEDCADPFLLNPAITRATVFLRILDKIPLYHCTAKKTYFKHVCEGSKLGIILDQGKSTYAVTKKYLDRDTINFEFRNDTKKYWIRTNQTNRTYINPLDGYFMNTTGYCVGKLQGNQTVAEFWQVDINLKISFNDKYGVSLPPDPRHKYVVAECPYHSEYCYDSSTHEHTFWKVAHPFTSQSNLVYGYEAFDNALIYTMAHDPPSKFLLVSKYSSYMAIRLVKELSFHPNSNITYWQTEHQLNVTFRNLPRELPGVKFRKTHLIIGNSRREAFFQMTAGCRLQQLEHKQNANLGTTADDVTILFIFLIIYWMWSIIHTVIKVTVNYRTLRRLGYIRVGGCKLFISSLSHTFTSRYIANHQHEGYDFLIVKIAMVGTTMENQKRHLDQLTRAITEMTNQRQPTDDTYDYVTSCTVNNIAEQAAAADQQETVESTEQSPKKHTNRHEYANLPNRRHLP